MTKNEKISLLTWMWKADLGTKFALIPMDRFSRDTTGIGACFRDKMTFNKSVRSVDLGQILTTQDTESVPT